MTVSDPMCTLLQLYDETETLAFDFLADDTVHVPTFDPGFPDVREVVNNRPNTDGVLDTTTYHGSRAVSMTLVLDTTNTAAALKIQKKLLQYCLPDRRPFLYMRMVDDLTIWRIQLRGTSQAAPYQIPLNPQLGWVAPDGLWEAADDSSWTISPSGGGTGTGWVLPAAFPINFGAGSPPGSVVLKVAGTRPTPPKIRIYGPVTAPGLTNTAGDTVAFVAGFTIPAGGYVSIDCAAGTVLANDDPSLTRMNSVDWSQSEFWTLLPGNNQISFTGTSTSAVTKAEITWRERTA